MYTFVFDSEKKDTDRILLQAMLVIAAVAAFVFRPATYTWTGYLSAALLLLAALFLKTLLHRFLVNNWLVIATAATVLLLVTWQVLFPVILLLYAALLQWVVKPPQLTITENGVFRKAMFSNRLYPWDAFNGIQIKDGLLVLDYKSNKIQYLPVPQSINEAAFNAYCAQKIDG